MAEPAAGRKRPSVVAGVGGSIKRGEGARKIVLPPDRQDRKRRGH